MEIEGPLSLSVSDDENTGQRRLEIRFREEFRALQLEQRVAQMKGYIQQLYQDLQGLPQGSADRTGVALVIQIAEELLPHVQQDALDLEAIIEMEIGGSENEIAFPLSDLH